MAGHHIRSRLRLSCFKNKMEASVVVDTHAWATALSFCYLLEVSDTVCSLSQCRNLT